MRTKQKKGVIADYLPWIIIGVIILTLVMISIFFLKGQGSSLIDIIKGLSKGG